MRSLAVTTILLGCTALAGKNNRNQRKELPLLRTVHKGFRDLSEGEVEALVTRFNCPDPKRPWQYWPLGCHHRHDVLQDDAEYSHIEWQSLDGPICTYYKKCLRNCRGIRSENNQCINPLTQVLSRGIKCNCKCSFACIERLNDIIDEHQGDKFATNDALLDDHGIVEVSDHHESMVSSLDEDEQDSDMGLILGVSEDEDANNEETPIGTSTFERSGQIGNGDAAVSTDTEVNPADVDLSHFECGDVTPNGLDADTQDRCHDYNWCHEEKFPCKYPCSRRCKQCLQQCPPCNCPKTGLTDGRTCPAPASIVNQKATWNARCDSNI